MSNEYSKVWFNIFMESKEASETKSEVAFIKRQLPLPKYKSVLDLCCGFGRHSNLLAQNGYEVIGVDRDKEALKNAEKLAVANVKFIQQDMRNIFMLPYSFDAVVCMWHSFGYFEKSENDSILRQISEILNPEGRFILDVYNKSFFEKNIGEREFEKQGVIITEKIKKCGDRFNVRLSYNNINIVDEFNWQLYSKDEIISICRNYNLFCKVACTWCDENNPITNNIPRLQFVFEKN